MSRSAAKSFDVFALFVRHRTAAYILMALMLVLGFAGFQQLNVAFFPTVELNAVSINIAWPGASAENVDEAITAAVEPEVRFLDGVREVNSRAQRGFATINLEFTRGTDMQKAVADVETALEQITTLPQDSERPRVTQTAFFERVASILLYGPFSEKELKRYAKQARDELLAAGVDKITLVGARDEEILVTIRPDQLRRYGLTHAEVANRIAQTSLDMPGGVLRGAVEQEVRAAALALDAQSVAAIDLRRFANGDALLLRDVARVEDGFDGDQPTGWRGEMRAMRLVIERSESAHALQTMARVRTWLEDAPARYPESLNLQMVDVQADKILQRITVLLKNGVGGIILVLGLLFLFLQPRAAMWVAIGMPVAMIAALGLMWPLGLSINMISMFALIMTIGIIVDDTVVVGEHAVTLGEEGKPPLEAAEQGARRMAPPVIAAALTTLAAFLPMLVVDNTFGDITRPMPYIVLAVLIASLLECFFVLPHHMAGALAPRPPRRLPAWLAWLAARQKAFAVRFEEFRAGRFRAWVAASFARRYEVLASALAALILSIGLMASGWLGFSFFPSPEGEVLNVSVYFHPGTPRAVTKAGLEAVEKSLYATEAQFQKPAVRRLFGLLPPPKPERIVYATFGLLGSTGSGRGDHRAQLWVELFPSEERSVRTATFSAAWRKNLPSLSGLSNIRIAERRAGPPGDDIDVRLERADAPTLKAAALDLKAWLGNFDGVSGLRDSLFYDKEALLMAVTPYGSSLGLDNRYLAQNLRHGLYGAIAKRFAREDEEVKIRVSLPQLADGVASLAFLDVRVPNSQPPQYVPLSSVVSLEREPGFASIQRINGVRAVKVTGDYDQSGGDSGQITQAMVTDYLPQLVQKYGIGWSMGGRNQDQAETLGRLRMGAFIALGLIYVVLAFVFSSFSRPGVIMSIIPFGFVGAVLGHFVQNFNLTFLSLIGLLGLSGILVNNSIILINRMEERMRVYKEDVRTAVLGAVQDRLRAVILTSGTTIMGLTPLLFETSLQAQFLLPMAITLVWGLLLGSFLILFLVPALLGIGEDWRLARMKRSGAARAPAE